MIMNVNRPNPCDRSCGTCAAYNVELGTPEWGTCRLHPPREIRGAFAFPTVKQDLWCLDHVEKVR